MFIFAYVRIFVEGNYVLVVAYGHGCLYGKANALFELLKIGVEEAYRLQRNQLRFMQFAFFIGLGIIAFHSLTLAGILLLNDIVVDFLCFIMAMNDKKNK